MADSLEDDVPGVLGHGRVFVALESGAKLFAAPHGNAVELLPGHRIRWMTMCGPTLFVLLVKTHGTSYRRVVGVDPQTLAIRFDLGELSTEPDGDWQDQMKTDGRIVVLATSPTSDEDDCQFWGVDPSGRVVWKQTIGAWNEHAFLGGTRSLARGSAGASISTTTTTPTNPRSLAHLEASGSFLLTTVECSARTTGNQYGYVVERGVPPAGGGVSIPVGFAGARRNQRIVEGNAFGRATGR